MNVYRVILRSGRAPSRSFVFSPTSYIIVQTKFYTLRGSLQEAGDLSKSLAECRKLPNGNLGGSFQSSPPPPL